jgi:hypothetical protein
MKRLSELETRRLALLARCEAQRAELSWRIAQLTPRRWTQRFTGGASGGAAGGEVLAPRHPLAWLLAAAALLLLRRPRDALSLLARARGALSLLTRTAQVLSIVGSFRRLRRR